MPPSTSHPTVLLVDDSTDVRETTAELLAELGFGAVTAASAEEALERIGSDAAAVGIDLVLTDLRMPGMGGHAFLEALAQRGVELPRIAYSSRPEAAVDERARRGELLFLRKPFAPSELRHAIRDAMERPVLPLGPRPIVGPDGGRAAARGTRSASTVRTRRPEPSSRSRRFGAPLLGLAAALALSVGLWQIIGPAAPPLPDAETARSTLRGHRVDARAPRGDVDRAPEVLSWEPLSSEPDAVDPLYRVRLVTVDGTLLFEGETRNVRLELPVEIRRALVPAVTYRWTVSAHDPDAPAPDAPAPDAPAPDGLLATSDTVSFRLLPTPRSPGKGSP